MAALVNLIFALVLALVLPLIARITPALAAERPAAPEIAAAPGIDTLRPVHVWASNASHTFSSCRSGERAVRVVVSQDGAAAPCEFRFVTLPAPAAPYPAARLLKT